MCNAVVIIKQFRELSLACLCTAVLSDAQPALATGSGRVWLSFEEIRTRLEIALGTPSLKHPAKTIAPGLAV